MKWKAFPVFFMALGLVLPPIRAEAADEVKLGMISVNAYSWPVWVAEEKGYFRDENLEISKTIIGSVTVAMQAVASNSANIIFPGSADGGINAQLGKAPVTVIAGGFTKAFYDLIAGEKYRRVEDLRGAQIGVISPVSGTTILLHRVLSAHGLQHPKDYSLLVVGGTSERYAAVRTGKVAAALVPPPVSFQALDAGLSIVANFANYVADYQFIVANANTDWIKASRDRAVRFLKALIRSERFINDPRNKEEAIRILQKGHKIELKHAAMVYKMMIEDFKAIPNDGSVSEKAMETVIQIMTEIKQLDRNYPPSMFVDNSLRQEAVKRLGG